MHLIGETKWSSLLVRAPFLESAGNFSGPKSIIQIELQRVRAGPLIIGAFEKRAPGSPPLLSVLRFEYLISGPKVTNTFEKRGPRVPFVHIKGILPLGRAMSRKAGK